MRNPLSTTTNPRNILSRSRLLVGALLLLSISIGAMACEEIEPSQLPGNWAATDRTGPDGERSIIEIDANLNGSAELYVWQTIVMDDGTPLQVPLWLDFDLTGQDLGNSQVVLELRHKEVCILGINKCFEADENFDSTVDWTASSSSSTATEQPSDWMSRRALRSEPSRGDGVRPSAFGLAERFRSRKRSTSGSNQLRDTPERRR